MSNNLWNIITNMSTIITCILFFAYIIGHIWKIKISKKLLYEKFQMEYLSDDEIESLDRFIDLDSKYGEIFSISSPNGINTICFYEINYNENNGKIEKGKLIKKINDIDVNEKVYVRDIIPEGIPKLYIALEKTDYIKIEFAVSTNGKNNEFVKTDYKCKMSLKSWIYYLCS